MAIREEGHLVGTLIFPEHNKCDCGGQLIICHNRKNFCCEICHKIVPRVKKSKKKYSPLFKWNPPIKDLESVKSMDSLLVLAFKRLKRWKTNLTLEAKLKDDVGVFAYDTNYGILTAKKYIWGFLVSCHKRILYSSLNQKKKIIMYIADNGKYYIFEPKEILKDKQTVTNLRNEIEMVNFNIKLGKRFFLE
jgi:hypothetical protein